jgi:hypothetical protein
MVLKSGPTLLHSVPFVKFDLFGVGLLNSLMLGPYLAEDWDWVGVAQIDWLRRWLKKRLHEQWSVGEVTIVSSHATVSMLAASTEAGAPAW